MFKNMLVLKVKAQEDREYVLILENGSPPGELYDALSAMQEHVLKVMNEYKKKEADKQKEEPKEEEPHKEEDEQKCSGN